MGILQKLIVAIFVVVSVIAGEIILLSAVGLPSGIKNSKLTLQKPMITPTSIPSPTPVQLCSYLQTYVDRKKLGFLKSTVTLLVSV